MTQIQRQLPKTAEKSMDITVTTSKDSRKMWILHREIEEKDIG
jgi:hypothetical protein